MEDRSNEIISQYDLKVCRSYRARGGMVLETDQGLKFLSPCRASERRLEFEDALKQQIQEHGYRYIDRGLRSAEQKLAVSNSIGERYCIRDWFGFEECSLRQEESVLAAAENLARLHLAMSGIRLPEDSASFVEEKLLCTAERRNRELKRVQSFLGRRKNKTAFEVRYLNCCGTFYEEAVRAAEALKELKTEEWLEQSVACGHVMHGSYTYHNILTETCGGRMACGTGRIATVNFDRAAFGFQVSDLYQYMRKVMEKNGWQYALGQKLLAAYEKVRALSGKEKQLLLVLLSYPEKFWKVTNYYYNSRKSLIPQKNMEKLEMLLAQQVQKSEFLRRLK